MLFTGSGTIKLTGCSRVKVTYFYASEFGERTFVYLKAKAMKGILEKLFIREVKVINPYLFLYKDSRNGLYNEDELVGQEEAVDLAKAYLEAEQAKLEAELANCAFEEDCG